MKKNLLVLFGISLFALTLGACTNSRGNTSSSQPDSGEVKQSYTVAFEVDGARYKTLRVKDGEKVNKADVPDPAKEGFTFVGWLEGTTLVDLDEYVVTKNVTFNAKFDENQGGGLNVDDVKDPSKTYYLVLGWWETTATNDDGTPKHTSNMNRDTTRLFYGNLNKYLLATGATQANLDAISFRNYSSDTVAVMGAAINADDDVDIMVGVGNNINSASGANVSLYGGTNDSKFQTNMGNPATARYVALLSTASEKGVAVYDWLKNTEAGKASFLRELTDAEIEASLVPETINLTVTVHGDTDKVTLLDDANDKIEMPNITVAEGKQFEGFATTQNAEEAQLKVAKDATLKYNDVKDLVAQGANTLDLYPVIKDAPVVEEDLIVYVQVQGSNLYLFESKLLEARFKAAHPDKNIKFNHCEVSNAAGFTAAIGDNPVDVIIGGNTPVDGYGKDSTGPTANAGAKHFASTNRKVIISDKVQASHKALAKDLYDFVVAEAPVFDVLSAVWTKGGDWVTADEKAAAVTGMTANINTYLNIGETETLLGKYNVTLTFEEVTTEGNRVADLTAATQALNSGKGADLILGCGNNIDSQTGYTTVVKKNVATSHFAANRYVALVHDNCLTRNIFDNYFVAAA